MIIEILDKAKKKRIIEKIEDFGIKKISQLLIRTGSERIRAFTGNFSNGEIMSLWKILPFEGVGLYVAKEISDKHRNTEIRLSVDGINLWKDQIDNHILKLTKEQEESWFKGKNIEINNFQKEEIDSYKGYLIIKSSDEKDFIGMGKIGDGVVYSYLPKERRRKSKEI
ncbi:MAG: hypothetical protein Q8N88_02125 [Nanoarchaeota archaeon]|nr:hypothetical protein [Nanoarchaeota archaeon]